MASHDFQSYNPIRVRLHGDQFAAKSLVRFGQAQVNLLENQMSHQGLSQSYREVEPFPGVIVNVGSSHGRRWMDIYVPPEVVIVPKDELDPVTSEGGCVCLWGFSVGEIVGMSSSGLAYHSTSLASVAYTRSLTDQDDHLVTYDVLVCLPVTDPSSQEAFWSGSSWGSGGINLENFTQVVTKLYLVERVMPMDYTHYLPGDKIVISGYWGGSDTYPRGICGCRCGPERYVPEAGTTISYLDSSCNPISVYQADRIEVGRLRIFPIVVTDIFSEGDSITYTRHKFIKVTSLQLIYATVVGRIVEHVKYPPMPVYFPLLSGSSTPVQITTGSWMPVNFNPPSMMSVKLAPYAFRPNDYVLTVEFSDGALSDGNGDPIPAGGEVIFGHRGRTYIPYPAFIIRANYHDLVNTGGPYPRRNKSDALFFDLLTDQEIIDIPGDLPCDYWYIPKTGEAAVQGGDSSSPFVYLNGEITALAEAPWYSNSYYGLSYPTHIIGPANGGFSPVYYVGAIARGVSIAGDTLYCRAGESEPDWGGAYPTGGYYIICPTGGARENSYYPFYESLVYHGETGLIAAGFSDQGGIFIPADLDPNDVYVKILGETAGPGTLAVDCGVGLRCKKYSESQYVIDEWETDKCGILDWAGIAAWHATIEFKNDATSAVSLPQFYLSGSMENGGDAVNENHYGHSAELWYGRWSTVAENIQIRWLSFYTRYDNWQQLGNTPVEEDESLTSPQTLVSLFIKNNFDPQQYDNSIELKVEQATGLYAFLEKTRSSQKVCGDATTGRPPSPPAAYFL